MRNRHRRKRIPIAFAAPSVLIAALQWPASALSQQKASIPKEASKFELGKQLFFDPRLSKDGTISCSSCHNVMLSGEDNRPNSVGVMGQHGGRTAPTVFNATYYSAMFWDGRAQSMEEQAKGPMINPIEMGNAKHDDVIARLLKVPGYVSAFETVFATKAVNIDQVADAISTYERGFAVKNSQFDQFKEGNTNALSEGAKRGMHIVEDIGCTSCHSGPNFNGPFTKGQANFRKFPTISGTDYEAKYHLKDDLGRFKADDPLRSNPAFKNTWRVASWRNIALTAPYFHNGSVTTLDEAVRVMAKTQLGLDLNNDQVVDIVEFLKSLTSNFAAEALPQLPRTDGTTLFDH